MRTLLISILLATPAQAWDFTPGQPCRLSHTTAQAQVELTYDPPGPLYSITLTRPDSVPTTITSPRFKVPSCIRTVATGPRPWSRRASRTTPLA